MHLGAEFVGCICLQYTFVSMESTQTMRIIYPQGYWYILCECVLCCISFKKKLCGYMFEGINVCILPFMQTDAQLTDIFY